MATFSAFIIGLIFAVGLGIGGMTQPGKVVGFLDIFGDWNPSLIFVMIGALFVHIIFYHLIRKRNAPLFAEKFQIPIRRDINRDLILGATLFGSGWGLAGFCPAPAITSLASLQLAPFVFVVSMLGGMWIFHMTNKTKS